MLRSDLTKHSMTPWASGTPQRPPTPLRSPAGVPILLVPSPSFGSFVAASIPSSLSQKSYSNIYTDIYTYVSLQPYDSPLFGGSKNIPPTVTFKVRNSSVAASKQLFRLRPLLDHSPPLPALLTMQFTATGDSTQDPSQCNQRSHANLKLITCQDIFVLLPQTLKSEAIQNLEYTADSSAR